MEILTQISHNNLVKIIINRSLYLSTPRHIIITMTKEKSRGIINKEVMI